MNDRYFYELELENVRSFKDKTTIEFHDRAEKPKPCQWNIIIGDNGTGKTTILRALSLLDNSQREIIFNFNTNYFYRDVTKKDKIFIKFICKDSNGTMISSQIEDFSFINIISLFSLNVYGYGATRKMGTRTISASDYGHRQNLWLEDELPHADNWLLEAAYKSNKKFKERVEILKKLFKNEISDIKKKTDPATGSIEFKYKTEYNWVKLDDMSLGFRSLAAWVANFVRGLEIAYPNSANFLEEPAILLLDEIDLHMHPKFQRHLLKFLGETFPKTQFIVTAHSPLIVQAAADVIIEETKDNALSKKVNLVLLKRNRNKVEVNNEPEIIQNWRLDQIVASDLFDLESARPIETERLMAEKQAILANYQRTKKDEQRLSDIEKLLGNVPYGKDKYEVIANDILQKIAQIISK
jgi:predicted ATP-binding protein involved in virulence